MFCQKCGKAISENATFCRYCGAKQEASIEQHSKELENEPIEVKVQEQTVSPPPNAISMYAIKCPHCKSREIAFVTEYHKALGARILQMILWIVLIPLLFLSIEESDGIPMLILTAITIALIQIYIISTEASTNVQCICKDCGKKWIHN